MHGPLSNSLTDAVSTMHKLCEQMDRLIEHNVELASRLRILESKLSLSDSRPDDNDSISVLAAAGRRFLKDQENERGRDTGFAFDELLFSSRVYRNVFSSEPRMSEHNDEIQTIKTRQKYQTTPTIGVSVFSGLTLAEISNISVLSLPLSACELSNPHWYGGNTTTKHEHEVKIISFHSCSMLTEFTKEPQYAAIPENNSFTSSFPVSPTIRIISNKRQTFTLVINL
jgi:hypothetical protein